MASEDTASPRVGTQASLGPASARAGSRPCPGTALAALLTDNKVLLFHAAYILMLALIGNLATSSPPPHPPHYASITI